MVIHLKGHRNLIQARGLSDDGVAHALGLGMYVLKETEFSPAQVLRELQAGHAALERRAGELRVPAALARNVQALAALIQLSPVECRVLEFTCLLHSSRVLDDCADLLGEFNQPQLLAALSVILGLRRADLQAVLQGQGALFQSDLVSVATGGSRQLKAKLELLNDALAEALQSPDACLTDIFKIVARPAPPPSLSLADFEHLQRPLAVLLPYLRHGLAQRVRGINIMVHGLPGVGKTELARVLAHALSCPLFEVVSEDPNGRVYSGEKRLRSLSAAQCAYGQQQALLLFDEAEDVFVADGFEACVASGRKAWVNTLLEEGRLPTLWLSNSIDDLDPAFARRFDMIFEMPVPPRARREQLLAQACGPLVDARTTARLAQLPHLAPAVAARAASVVCAVGAGLNGLSPSDAFAMLVGNTLVAQGHPLPPAAGAADLLDHFDPAFLHADADLQQVLAGLRQAQSARLCLWGPPGTGKSAYGRWLAQALDRPLVVQRGSDLMSKYVGESEKRIARAFRQAANDGAVLMIDEVDGFLRDRQAVGQSWEVSQVNEMLTQMESYEGVFVAST
ncbi:AAA family ATPase, partial [Curvibacter gracilis]|uniref:AAA family ATPase n=1 Tax=Curvibacter gracilis TaxID=230310 RepID=UPI000480A916